MYQSIVLGLPSGFCTNLARWTSHLLVELCNAADAWSSRHSDAVARQDAGCTLLFLRLIQWNSPKNHVFSFDQNRQVRGKSWSSTLINWWSNDDQLSTINYETSGDSWSYPKRGGWCQTDQVSNLEIPDFQRKTIETYAQFSALIQKRMRGICIPLPNISG